jgi:hypothetical protein
MYTVVADCRLLCPGVRRCSLWHTRHKSGYLWRVVAYMAGWSARRCSTVVRGQVQAATTGSAGLLRIGGGCVIIGCSKCAGDDSRERSVTIRGASVREAGPYCVPRPELWLCWSTAQAPVVGAPGRSRREPASYFDTDLMPSPSGRPRALPQNGFCPRRVTCLRIGVTALLFSWRVAGIDMPSVR